MKITKQCFQCEQQYTTYTCNIKNSARTFCSSICYGNWQRGKSFIEQNKPLADKSLCIIDDCIKPIKGHGYCSLHYYRLIERKKRNTQPRIPASDWNCLFCLKKFKASKRTGNKDPIYCSRECSSENRKKPYIVKKGYRKLLIPKHSRADKKGYVFEHIVVMETYLGRSLVKNEVVHHIDHDRGNNKIENLMLFDSHSKHMAYHLKDI